MAEGFLKNKLEEKGRKDVTVSSAGTIAIDGFIPTDRTILVMKKEGIDVSVFRTSKLTAGLMRAADLILVMEHMHRSEVLNLLPDAASKTHLLRQYTDIKGKEEDFTVPDPIGRPLEVYERVLGMIKKSIEELVKEL